MRSIFETIPYVVLERFSKHAAIDCDLVLNRECLSRFPPVFFYGVAHILKHKVRHKARALDRTPTTDLEQESLALAHTVNWADEFFYLSNWSLRAKLYGPPDPASYKEPSELFLALLVQLEWADLVREALCLHCKNLSLGKAARECEIWRYPRGFTRERSLRKRALLRYRSAQDLIDWFKTARRRKALADFRKSAPGRAAIRVAEWTLHVGFACLYACDSNSPPDAQSHITHAWDVADKPEQKSLVRRLTQALNERRGLDETAALWASRSKQDLTAIHLLADWIEDLLCDESHGTLHPRVTLPINMRRSGKPANFPNMQTIERLQDLLGQHLDWLQFMTENSAEYVANLGAIEEEKRKLRDAVFRPPAKQEHIEGWELSMLRDWGSYTPLLPRTVRRESWGRTTGGGGCFLRCHNLGIVIDPGFDFIEHFYEADLTAAMITHVIVTHDHYDHVASFGPLLNLLYKDRMLHGRSSDKVTFLLSRGVFDQYARHVVDFEHFASIEPLTDDDRRRRRRHILSRRPHIEVSTTHTQHGSANGFGAGGVGLVFRFTGLPTLGLTSDTGWYGQHYCSSGDADSRSLGKVLDEFKPDVLVLHVGSLLRHELRDSGFYKTHLGARGVFRTLASVESCRLAVLTEFGEECCEHRLWFAEKIEDWFQSRRPEFRCFPSDRRTRILGKKKRELRVGAVDHDAVEYTDAVVEATDGGFQFKRRAASGSRK